MFQWNKQLAAAATKGASLTKKAADGWQPPKAI